MNPRIWISFGRVRGHSDVGIDFSLAVFHKVCLGVREHDFVGGADAGEKCAVNGGWKELRGGFARKEDPVLDGRSYLPAQTLRRDSARNATQSETPRSTLGTDVTDVVVPRLLDVVEERVGYRARTSSGSTHQVDARATPASHHSEPPAPRTAAPGGQPQHGGGAAPRRWPPR